MRDSLSCTRIMASCWPELLVYAADQSGFKPISETIISRSLAGIDNFRNSSTSPIRFSVSSSRKLDGARTDNVICPASTCGKNSRPIPRPSTNDAKNSVPTPVITDVRLLSDQSRIWTYRLVTLSIKFWNCWEILAIRPTGWLCGFVNARPGLCSSGRKRAHIMGTNVLDNRKEVSMAKPTASVSGRNRKPPIPGIMASGARTITVVHVATNTGTITSAQPSSAARMRDLPI